MDYLKKPLITIITVTYNAADVLHQTIRSIVNQSYPFIEYIIIDGGSTDGTLDIIKQYEDKISYWISEPDKGIYDAMNKGIDKANGEWINFMNAGDWFYNFNTISECFERENIVQYDIIYGNTEIRYGSRKEIYKPAPPREFWKRLIIHQCIFSKSEINRKNKFDTSLRVSADFDFIYKMFFYKWNLLQLDIIISSFDIVGYSHHNRYIGFSEDRGIALKYKGNIYMSFRVYTHYIFVTLIGKTLDFFKRFNPTLYNRLKALKDKN